jgi:putative glutamine amidotransferase
MSKTKKRTIKVLVNDKVDNTAYIKFLETIVDVVTIPANTWDGGTVDLALFIGGSDVSPILYGEETGANTQASEARDSYESKYMYNRLSNHTPKLGICRGAQFLTVYAGGKLIQDVSGHAISTGHSITFAPQYGIGDLLMPSTHHQMMYPYDMDSNKYNIIATSTYYLSNKYYNGDNKNITLPDNFMECEIIHYPNKNSLAIQGHPELDTYPYEYKDLILDLIFQTLKL